MKAKYRLLISSVLLCVCLAAMVVFDVRNAIAVTVGPPSKGYNLRFNNPGARANGMGGAFIAVADDATAAYTNPAGLTILTKPEIALEYKFTEYDIHSYSTYVEGGESKYKDIKTTNDVNDVSFVSFAYPMKKATFTIYRHKLIQTDTEVVNFLNYPDQNTVVRTSDRLKIDVNTIGISGAFKLKNSISLGIGVGFSEADTNFTSNSIYTLPGTVGNNSDTATHASVGILWDVIDEVSIGATYKYGPEFDFIYGGIRDEYKVPDIYSVAIAYRPKNDLTFTAEVNFIQYSQSADQLNNPLYQTENNNGDTVSPDNGFEIDDGVDVRAGVEYVFSLSEMPFAIRAGYHYNPQHTLYYDQQYSTDADKNLEKQWPKDDDEHIGTFGFGFVPTENVQFDFSGSWSDMSQEYTASAVYRFD